MNKNVRLHYHYISECEKIARVTIPVFQKWNYSDSYKSSMCCYIKWIWSARYIHLFVNKSRTSKWYSVNAQHLKRNTYTSKTLLKYPLSLMLCIDWIWCIAHCKPFFQQWNSWKTSDEYAQQPSTHEKFSWVPFFLKQMYLNVKLRESYLNHENVLDSIDVIVSFQ